METNSYQAIVEFLSNRLNKLEFPLYQNAIKDEVEKVKVVITTVGLFTFGEILSIENFESPSEADWQRIIRELEQHYQVKLEKGVLIQGEEQRIRDTSWWTSIYKQKVKNYFSERYQSYLSKSLPPEVIKTIDDDTDIVMNNIENPIEETFSRYGMVVGHVQSGKTGNYAALICKAADAGYKFVVVIAGGINNLRNQTQERLNESFIGQTKGVQVGAGKGNTSKDTTPLSLTTIERDFNKQDADRLSQGLNFDNISVPILLVVKKHSRTLDNVIDWLEKQYINKVSKHAMLVIDDESDYASINTKDEDDPTSINKRLRKLLSLFQKSAYVAFTATPFANIFIDHEAGTEDLGRDLFPKDFIYALDAPTNYFGARKIFIDNPDLYLVPISDHEQYIPPDHDKEYKIDMLPGSLCDALRVFVLNVSIRSLRNQGDKHNSMLIHATRFTEVHKSFGNKVGEYLKELKKHVIAYGKLKDAERQSEVIGKIKETFANHYRAIEFSWHSVLTRLVDVINSIVVREVHQKTTVPLEYRKDVATNAIVIGGTSLSRGFTLEGLSVSYFLRNTVFYDTLMQMGRWFGYRPGYEDLCKIFMPATRILDYAEIIGATDELFENFKLMAEYKKTPEDFGLAVRENPHSMLQITARNKLKNAKEFLYSMRLDGTAKETSYLSKEADNIRDNIEAVKKLVGSLHGFSKVENSYVWRRVDKQKILPFLKSFRTVANDRLGLSSRMPISFIEKYTEDRNTLWDVALYSGTGGKFEGFGDNGEFIYKERRQFSINKNGYLEVQNRQVSSGNSEAIAIEDETLRKKLGNKRKQTREHLERPLLMLHILEQSFPDEQVDRPTPIHEIAAFGVSFPGNVLSTESTVTLKINTVFYQQLINELETEGDNDD